MWQQAAGTRALTANKASQTKSKNNKKKLLRNSDDVLKLISNTIRDIRWKRFLWEQQQRKRKTEREPARWSRTKEITTVQERKRDDERARVNLVWR